MDELGRLLAAPAGVAVQLALTVSAVVQTDRLQLAVYFDEQHNGIVHDVAPNLVGRALRARAHDTRADCAVFPCSQCA
jgi:hypothetical protein